MCQDSGITLDLLVKFQEAIVGIVGFVGVIITLVANESLARRSRQEQIEDTRSAPIRSLSIKLFIFSDQINNIKLLVKKSGCLTIPHKVRLINNIVFCSFINNIGLRKPEAIRVIMKAYLYYNAINSNTDLFIRDRRAVKPGDWATKYPPIFKDWIRMLSEAKK